MQHKKQRIMVIILSILCTLVLCFIYNYRTTTILRLLDVESSEQSIKYGCFPSRITGQAMPIPNEELDELLHLLGKTSVRFCKNDPLKETSSDVKLYDIHIFQNNNRSISFSVSSDGYFYCRYLGVPFPV